MKVTVGGNEYEFHGLMFGLGPVWKLLLRAGQQMTREEFMALPDADKRELMDLAKKYVAGAPNLAR